MIGTIEDKAKPVLDALAREGLADCATVIVVGSSARKAMNWRSDIDVLVLRDDDRRVRMKRRGDIHLQQDSRLRFLRRLQDGDDYPAWALRFGVPVSDPDGWWAEQASAEHDSPHWPDWQAKVPHARKRMRMALALLDTGDVDAANEEMLFAASHVVRAVLLRQGVFPLSRPEMPSQLDSVDSELAQLLVRLMNGDMDAAALRSDAAMLEERLRLLSGEACPSSVGSEGRGTKASSLPSRPSTRAPNTTLRGS